MAERKPTRTPVSDPAGESGPERERSVRSGKNGRPQLRARKTAGWTKRRRTAFLDHLAATCNVTASAAAAGLHWSGAYALRRREPEFAAQWQSALEAGYARLEAMLLARASSGGDSGGEDGGDGGGGGGGGGGPEPDEPVPPEPEAMDTELALNLLRIHRAPLKGQARRASPKVTAASKKELIQAIKKQLLVLRRRLVAEGRA